MIFREFDVVHDGRKTVCDVRIPEAEGKLPVIIFSHGYNCCKDDFEYYADYFADKGFIYVRLSFSGGSSRDTSGYPTTEMSVMTEREDLLAVFEEVCSWDEVDTTRIHLMGESMGGLVSALCAATLQDRIKGIVLLYPALCVVDDWKKMFDGKEIPEVIDFWNLQLGSCFMTDIMDLDVFGTISGYEGPVRLFHGTQDAVVPVDYSRRASKVYANCVYTELEKENHGFSAEGNNIMEPLAYEFILKNNEA